MIIEAIEEGKPGTYMAEVLCNRYGSVSVLRWHGLLVHEPFSTKEMAAKLLFSLESICNPVNDLYYEKLDRLTKISQSLEKVFIKHCII